MASVNADQEKADDETASEVIHNHCMQIGGNQSIDSHSLPDSGITTRSSASSSDKTDDSDQIAHPSGFDDAIGDNSTANPDCAPKPTSQIQNDHLITQDTEENSGKVAAFVEIVSETEATDDAILETSEAACLTESDDSDVVVRLSGVRTSKKRPVAEQLEITDDEEETTNDNDEDEDVYREPEEAVVWTPPVHKWNALKCLRDRECGHSIAHKSPNLFPAKATGALHFVERFELMYKMRSHNGCVNCLHFNASGSKLVSGSDDLKIIIWDWASNRQLLKFDSGHRSNIFQAKFMPLSGDCHVVSCARDGQVRLSELSTRGVCKTTRKLAQHHDAANKITFEVDAPHTFLTCGEDAVVFHLDLRAPKPNKLLKCTEQSSSNVRGSVPVPLYSIHSHPRNPYYFVAAGRDPRCRLYDKRMLHRNAVPVKAFCPSSLTENGTTAHITSAIFSYDGSEILASYNDDYIYLFDTNSSDVGAYKQCYKGHRNSATVKAVNFFGAKSEFVMSGSDCGYIYFWEKESGTIVKFMAGDESGVVNVLEPHPTCPILATSGLDHDVKVWMPSCEDPQFNLGELETLTKRNARQREHDRLSESEFEDTRMLFFLMSRIRRAAMRSRANDNQSDDSIAEFDWDDDEDDEDDEDDDDDDTGSDLQAVQCQQS